jgi:hypothetical protein
MTAETTPVATVTGLYRGTGAGLELLNKDNPLMPDEVRDMPVFFELELADEDADLIVEILYDNMAPIRLPDRFRGTDIPRGIRFWPDWFEIPPYREMRDVTGRRVYPRAPGIHTVRIRTAETEPAPEDPGLQPGQPGLHEPALRICHRGGGGRWLSMISPVHSVPSGGACSTP